MRPAPGGHLYPRSRLAHGSEAMQVFGPGMPGDAARFQHLTDDEGTVVVARRLWAPVRAPQPTVAPSPVRTWPVIAAAIAAVAMILLALLIR